MLVRYANLCYERCMEKVQKRYSFTFLLTNPSNKLILVENLFDFFNGSAVEAPTPPKDSKAILFPLSKKYSIKG